MPVRYRRSHRGPDQGRGRFHQVGMGPGSSAPPGLPVSACADYAIVDCAEVARKYNIPIIADGGIKYSGDIARLLPPVLMCHAGQSLCRNGEPRYRHITGPQLQDLPWALGAMTAAVTAISRKAIRSWFQKELRASALSRLCQTPYSSW